MWVSGSESARQSSLASRNKIWGVDTTPKVRECLKEYGRWKDVGDNKHETNIQMMSNTNVTSTHGVQDEDECYNELLNWLSAESEMQIEGWSRTSSKVLWHYKYMNIQILKNNWKRKCKR